MRDAVLELPGLKVGIDRGDLQVALLVQLQLAHVHVRGGRQQLHLGALAELLLVQVLKIARRQPTRAANWATYHQSIGDLAEPRQLGFLVDELLAAQLLEQIAIKGNAVVTAQESTLVLHL